MSDLLTIKGAISIGAGETTRTEITARTAPDWNLPLAGAVLLHLGVLLLMALGLGGKRELSPEVYPIRLYSVVEVFTESAAVAPPARPILPVRPPPSVAPSVAEAGAVAAPSPPQFSEISPAVASVVAAALVSASAAVSSSETTALIAAPVQTPRLAGGTGSPSAFSGEVGSAGVDGAHARGVGGATAGPIAPPVVLARPRYRENPDPEYPALARRRNREGTVVLEVLVDTAGKVGGLAVEQSSGHRLLDEAALKGVKGWRFEPGRLDGEPLAMKVRLPVRFALR